MDRAEAYKWIAVFSLAVVAGLCRALHNGNYRSAGHAVGVIGCSGLGAAAVVAVVDAMSDTVHDNTMVAIGVAVLIALSGKELYERCVQRLLVRVGILVEQDVTD